MLRDAIPSLSRNQSLNIFESTRRCSTMMARSGTPTRCLAGTLHTQMSSTVHRSCLPQMNRRDHRINEIHPLKLFRGR